MMRPTLLLLLVCSSESLHVQKTGETSGRGCIFGMCVWSDPHNAAQTTTKTDKEIYTDLAMKIDAERKQLEMDMTPNCFLGHWCEDTQAIKVRHENRIQELEMSQRTLAEQYGTSKQYADDKEEKVFEDMAAKNGAASEKSLEARAKAAKAEEEAFEKEEKAREAKEQEGKPTTTKNPFASDEFGGHSQNQAKDIVIMRGKDAPERVKSDHDIHAERDDLERQEWEKQETNPENWDFLDQVMHAATSRWNNLFSAPPAPEHSIGRERTPAPLMTEKEVLASPTRPTGRDGHDQDRPANGPAPHGRGHAHGPAPAPAHDDGDDGLTGF